MSRPLFDATVEMSVDLPWSSICKLATLALCSGISMDDLINESLDLREQQDRSAA